MSRGILWAVLSLSLLLNACAPESEPPADAGLATEARNKELFRTVAAELFGAKDLSAIDRYYASDYVNHHPERAAMAEAAGIDHAEATKRFFGGMFAAFPDLRIEIDHLYAEDDTVFAFTTYRGTHRGEFMGMPATGEAVTIRTAEIFRIEDGLFVEHWDVVDDSGLAAVLDASPADGDEARP